MNTKSNKNFSILLLLGGALLVGFSAGRWLNPLAAWIGPVLILRYSRDHKVWRGFFLILTTYILAFLIGYGQMWESNWGLPAMFVLGILYGFLWSLPYLADRLVSVRLRGFLSTLVFPLAVTTIEVVNTQVNPVGDWGATGFTQYGNLPLMQLASITGMIGITFLMSWFASVANWAWENRRQVSVARWGLAAFGVVFALVFIYGFLRLNLSSSNETIRVAGITAQSWAGSSMEELIQQVPSLREAYFSATVREAQAGARVVIWPEISGAGIGSEEASLIARAQEVARQNGIYLALPLYTIYPDTGKKNENKLLLIDPTGAIVMEHLKYGGNIFEGTLKGDGKLQAVTTPFGLLSCVICYDMDYPAVIQQTGQNGTGLLLVPSKDWRAVDPAHSHMAVFHAIENGMSIVRQVDTGLSIAVDPYGRVLAQTDFYGSTDRTMIAQVPTQHVDTIYTSFGHWFGWICLLGFLSLILYTVVRASTERQKVK
jgi:apolipoprotein N-acyltransferase